jgi:hypothetical protein
MLWINFNLQEMKISISVILFFFLLNPAHPQKNCSFCNSVENGNFNKAERIFKREIKKYRYGTKYDNGPGSGIQTKYTSSFDSLTNWLKYKRCVEDAYWDKCQIKEDIYPGWSSIGVKFKTSNGTFEKCFYIQEGTLGQIYFFGWRPKVFKARNILVYKKMYDCSGFIEQQKKECDQSKILSRLFRDPSDTTKKRGLVLIDSLTGRWVNIRDRSDTVEFNNSVYSSTLSLTKNFNDPKAKIQNPYYFRKAKNKYVEDLGWFARWQNNTCLIEINPKGELTIVYSNCKDEEAGTLNYCLKKYKRSATPLIKH